MADRRGIERRLTKETKGAGKTSEFRLTVAVIFLILVSAFMIKSKGTGDQFVARQAWLYVAIVTGAYAVSRGLAKSGVREYPEDAAEGDSGGSGGSDDKKDDD